MENFKEGTTMENDKLKELEIKIQAVEDFVRPWKFISGILGFFGIAIASLIIWTWHIANDLHDNVNQLSRQLQEAKDNLEKVKVEIVYLAKYESKISDATAEAIKQIREKADTAVKEAAPGIIQENLGKQINSKFIDGDGCTTIVSMQICWGTQKKEISEAKLDHTTYDSSSTFRQPFAEPPMVALSFATRPEGSDYGFAYLLSNQEVRTDGFKAYFYESLTRDHKKLDVTIHYIAIGKS